MSFFRHSVVFADSIHTSDKIPCVCMETSSHHNTSELKFCHLVNKKVYSTVNTGPAKIDFAGKKYFFRRQKPNRDHTLTGTWQSTSVSTTQQLNTNHANALYVEKSVILKNPQV